MDELSGKKVIFCVSGGIAAYKAVGLLRALVRGGADVHPVMTKNATKFVNPLSFSALAKREASVSMFPDSGQSLIHHIELTEDSDLMIVVPATANIIGKFASGIADDLVSTIYLAAPCPVVIVPAMNVRMYSHPQVQENIKKLKELGVVFVGPDEGALACGEGRGRMAKEEEVYRVVQELLLSGTQLAGKNVLITAGPTREYIDPIRFITNESSGLMGYTLAECAKNRGARVILVSGPTQLSPPAGIEYHSVVSAEEMHKKVVSVFPKCDIAILAAAVGDFSPEKVETEKIKKEGRYTIDLRLKKTVDILKELGEMRGEEQLLIGFSLETESLMENARRKKSQKNCSVMVANLRHDDGAGIGSSLGKVTIIGRDREISLPAENKTLLARKMWDVFAEEFFAIRS